MKSTNLFKEVKTIEKRDFNTKKQEDSNKKTYSNLPQVRKVAIAKRRTKFVMLVFLFISCFSLSAFIGFFGPFLLFK